MSYDLLFFPRADGSPPVAEVLAYFRARPHYEVSADQAIYQNEDTGVYFIWNVGLDEPEADEPASLVQLNINLFRPHVFGLEAEPEIAAFLAAFALPFHDPQTQGMADGPYARERFLAGYGHANAFGYRAMLRGRERKRARDVLPGAILESCWRWNYERDSFQERLGDSIFVPKISFVRVGGKLQSCVVWTDGIPAALPDVDLYVVVREELAPRKLLRAKHDVALADTARAAEVLAPFSAHEGPRRYHLLDYTERPERVTRWVRSLTPDPTKLEGIALDSILNVELVEA